MIREQPRLYGEADLPWIAAIVDHVVESCGQPWRVLRERLEHVPVAASRVEAILTALRRTTGGGAARKSIARRVRSAVLGVPTLDPASRTARLDEVAASMGLPRDEFEALLWIDLAGERPVVLPDGRPAEHRLAAYANLERIQRLVRRARTLRLRVWGDAIPLVRATARYGLLATITVAGDATVLDVIGPLALFHVTTVYGRALAQLVPLLADVPRFELELVADLGHGPVLLAFASPILLPPIPLSRLPRHPAARLARELAATTSEPRDRDAGSSRASSDLRVTLDPPPIEHGADRLFPDLAVELAGRQHVLELVGFATYEYLTAKLARYRVAGVTDVLLCVDDARAEATRPDEARAILRYTGRLDAAAVRARLGG